ncbi:MAG: hypothetical protein ACYC61_33605, partial [Isosphaeraceae bacterium]
PAPVAPRPATPASIPVPRTAAPASVPVAAMAGVAAGDSGWWELDSSDAIPVPLAVATAGGRRPAVVAAVPAATDWATVDETSVGDDDLIELAGARASSSSSQRKWVKPAALAAGVVVGSIAFVVMYILVSGATRSSLEPDGDPGAPEVAKTAENPAPPPAPAPPEQADAPPATRSSPAISPAASRHRETVDDLMRAYNQIADGYARIRDTSSIAAGRAQVARGAVQLRASAHRGKTLPALSPAERKALIQQSGPQLLQAIDRVLDELRRLKSTEGIRSDFDRLIDAYTRSREQVQRELDAA